MAEVVTSMLIGPLVSIVKNKVSSYLLDEYKVMEGMEEQRSILERRLPAILHIIDDAEEKGAYQPGVNAWLKALKKVSYEANDVFDELKYEALRREAKKRGHKPHHNRLDMDVVNVFPAYNPIVFRRRMGKKLQKIVQDIEALVAEMNAFGFRDRRQSPSSMPLRQMDSIMIDSEKDIVTRSRNEEKKKIVKILLDHGNSNDLLVLPIVGLGGLGKTTFVQLVYSEPEMKHFQFRKWCCVSDDFDVGSIARSICNSTEKDSEKVLQDLQKELSGKRCLVVLDDVWNQDVDKWEKLKTCLKYAGMGSAILTTTRNAKVAQIMSGGKVQPHNLANLGDEFLKKILERRAFILKKPEYAKLEDVINEIVKRCHGSPLAAKAIGSLLSTKTSEDEWMAVLKKSSICNVETGIFPILKLSYDNLPLHMKQCFALCAVFPKDYEIDVENLIHLWMANDYLPLEEDIPLETTGRRIFDELAWRSFFEDAKQTKLEDKTLSHFRGINTCKIHDLMHDIALSILGEECTTITHRSDPKKLLSKHSRHMFSSYRETGTNLIDFLKKQAGTLQTLLCPYPGAYNWTPHMPKCNSLRALKLPGCSAFKIRPRHLQHLRYLDLSGNWWIKQLPEEISILYNLQTLNVLGCDKLCRLPRDMKFMASLRHLYTEDCRSLKCMPPDLGELSSLQILTYFVASDSTGCSTIGELRSLNLGGKLMLNCLENVTEAQAKAATLGNKKKLRHLSLEWSSECHGEPVPGYHKKVLDALKPHDEVEKLRIVGYKSTCLPTWMKYISLSQKHLTELHLVGITMCEDFPQFSYLEALQILHIEELDKLQSLCSDEASLTFLKLKELQLCNLKSMERWVAAGGEGEVAFPQLENLIIKGCPKLATLPDTPNLKVVELDEDKAQLSLLIFRVRYISLLIELRLSVFDKEAALELDDENVESPLLGLRLSGCDLFFLSSPTQPAVGIWKWFGKLVSLEIYSCSGLIYWPEDVFQSLESLKHLEVWSCGNLVGPAPVKGRPAPTTRVLPHLNSLRVLHCDSLAELFVIPPSITKMHIEYCRSLKFTWEEVESKSVHVQHLDTSTSLENCPYTSEPKQSAAQTNQPLPRLEVLLIYACDSLVTLADLPPALRVLVIFSCQNICSVSGQLDTLQNLDIVGCNKLQSLDSLGHLPSLKRLRLERCKRLTSVPGALGGYSALRRLTIRYCPSINMKPLYERHQQHLDSLVERDLSHTRSSDPFEGTTFQSISLLFMQFTFSFTIRVPTSSFDFLGLYVVLFKFAGLLGTSDCLNSVSWFLVVCSYFLACMIVGTAHQITRTLTKSLDC
jgi:Leucine-rich repeat (LRR) protein